MTRDEGNRAHRHPDAVAYLEGLTEDEARVHPPLVRAHDGGFTRYWIEGGEVRSRDVAGDGLEHDIAGAVPAEFGPPFRGWRRTWRRARPTWTPWSGPSGTPRWAAARRP